MNKLSHRINSPNSKLVRLTKILSLALAINLVGAKPAQAPIMEKQKQDMESVLNHIHTQQLNDNIPCDTRQNLWNYLDSQGYIREYSWQDWLGGLPLDSTHRQYFDSRILPIISDTISHPNADIILNSLMFVQTKQHSLTGLTNPLHRKLVELLGLRLPQPRHIDHYIDPEVVSQLNDCNTQALIDLLTNLPSPSNAKPSKSRPERLNLTDSNDQMEIYTQDDILKYPYHKALTSLQQHQIGLSSSSKGTNESGNNLSMNRTSLVGINVSTIDGTINLINIIRASGGHTGREYITGGTEFGHSIGIQSHGTGYKVDLRNSPLILSILLDYDIKEPNKNYGPIQIGEYNYIFNYHGPDRHLDILITPGAKRLTLPDVKPIPQHPPRQLTPGEIRKLHDQIKQLHIHKPQKSII